MRTLTLQGFFTYFYYTLLIKKGGDQMNDQEHYLKAGYGVTQIADKIGIWSSPKGMAL